MKSVTTIIPVFVMVLVILTLTACSDSTAPSGEATSPPQSESTSPPSKFILDNWRNINESITAIGTLLTGLAAFIALPKLVKTSNLNKLKEEIFFNDEARMKYEELENLLPTTHPLTWGPTDWKGGANFNYMLEITPHKYSPGKDGIEWKDIKKSIRYVYPESGKLKVKGWRIK